MSIGDIVIYECIDSDFRLQVRVLDLFKCDGIKYAEVEPVEFKSISREIPVSRLKPLN